MNHYEITFHCDDGDPALIVPVEAKTRATALRQAVKTAIDLGREPVTVEIKEDL